MQEEKVLVVDQQKCTGCRLCELVCSVFHTGTSNPSRSRVKVVKWEDVGFYLPMAAIIAKKPTAWRYARQRLATGSLKTITG